MSEERFWTIVLALCAVGAGLAAFAGAVAMFRKSLHLLRHGKRVQGTVVDQRERVQRDVRGETTRYYHPVVEFRDEDGQLRRLEGAGSTWRARMGKKRSVIYEPGKARDAELASFFHMWILPLLVAAMGGLLAWLGGAMGLGRLR